MSRQWRNVKEIALLYHFLWLCLTMVGDVIVRMNSVLRVFFCIVGVRSCRMKAKNFDLVAKKSLYPNRGMNILFLIIFCYYTHFFTLASNFTQKNPTV